MNAALKLAAKKDIDKITVKDITEECHITRQTFYYHFQDVADMLDWGLSREVDRLAAESRNCESMEEILHYYCEVFIIDNKTVIFKILHSRYYLFAVEKLVESLKMYFLKLLEYRKPESRLPFKDGVFLLDYHVSAIMATFLRWGKEKEPDVKNGIRQIVLIVQGDLHI